MGSHACDERHTLSSKKPIFENCFLSSFIRYGHATFLAMNLSFESTKFVLNSHHLDILC